MSLVLVAILVVIWASILVPLLRRDHATWPGGRRSVLQAGAPSAPIRGGRAVWRPEPEPVDDAGWTAPLLGIDGGAAEKAPRDVAALAELGPVARWGRVAASRTRRGHRGQRAMFRRRQALAVLVVAAAVAAVPALLAGGRWWMLETAAVLSLAAYLLALVVLARRRHAPARPARATPAAGPAPTGPAGPRLAAVPASPE